ncbi:MULTISPECIES: TetR/AcrR family transcriptional regulator [unclassified Halorubrum]|uniref:TetR/AcrR family transcriptional regulator n=1 Tax=unclassified Halorubrum TaxID=2642239 RepID=UPI000B99CD5A|nr:MULTISPECIES: TetR/AcrR family transcriptional regulator [unclassified Halorubrum]OYR44658.1 TetR family transcriptional regulator [Halorubrum sp. Hd13]OYR46512.1 TetR family transcriptional regulator [Halorubrum sp. Ea8]OYR47228.1 TetR family transcriptional regulator [Halorubrum sp. Eb13]OYR55102.1 TetR family transcriptional regulator [Halorubrum sp. Ea1]
MHDPFAEPADTRQAILGAAFRALCEHGYADLTISRIGEEFDKSPSLVYHHYDGKDELLVDLLGFLLDGFEASVSAGEFDLTPHERLDIYLSATTDPGSVDDEHAPDAQFLTVIVELRAQAASDGAYRDHFDRSDRVFEAFLERTVREAAAEIDGGTDVDADRDGDDSTDPRGDASAIPPIEVASTLQTLATGGMLRWATTADRDWTDDTRRGARRYLEAMLPRVDVEG